MHFLTLIDPPLAEPVYDLGVPALVAVAIVALIVTARWLRRRSNT